MPVYNKLVRDKIPEIIHSNGKACTTKVLNDGEYEKELKKKLKEEMTEYLSAQNKSEALEELADVLEIIHALSHIHGASIEQVEKIRVDKAQIRGGFNDMMFLVEVEDE